MNTDFAQNTMKLRRIMDKMPKATEEELKAEYIKQGGLLNKVEEAIYLEVQTVEEISTEEDSVEEDSTVQEETPKKTKRTKKSVEVKVEEAITKTLEESGYDVAKVDISGIEGNTVLDSSSVELSIEASETNN